MAIIPAYAVWLFTTLHWQLNVYIPLLHTDSLFIICPWLSVPDTLVFQLLCMPLRVNSDSANSRKSCFCPLSFGCIASIELLLVDAQSSRPLSHSHAYCISCTFGVCAIPSSIAFSVCGMFAW